MQPTQTTTKILLVRPEHAERVALLSAISEGTIPIASLTEAARRSYASDGNQSKMTIAGGIARIPIDGVLMRGASWSGTTCLDQLAANVNAAEKDNSVNCILLCVDSPGGTVNGTPECADVVSNTTKPTIAFVSGQCASAAYWIASCADQIFASQSSEIGSIGALMQVFDFSGMLAQMGIKNEVISSGKYKGMGAIGTSLSPDQRAHLQDHVNSIAADFKTAVQVNRYPRSIDAALMDGQMFHAKAAAASGLIDGIMRSEEAVLSLLG